MLQTLHIAIDNCYSGSYIILFFNLGSLSVDWINSKVYWVDVRERQIGVLDLDRNHYKFSLVPTDPNVSPRGLAVDPTTR